MKYLTGLLVLLLILVNITLIFFHFTSLEQRYTNTHQLAGLIVTNNIIDETIPTSHIKSAKKVLKKIEEEKKPTIALPEKSKIAIVLDDLGVETFKSYLLDRIKTKINLAIIPGMQDSKKLVQKYAKDNRFELIMHLPMEPMNSKDMESKDGKGYRYKYLITTDMDEQTITEQLTEALDSLDRTGVIKGMNNHMGSKATRSRITMKSVMPWLKNNNLYFLDSRTISTTVGYETAKELQVPALYNEIFLDGQDDELYVTKQLAKAKNLAKKNGFVIAIGHIQRESTIVVLFRELPKLQNEGYELVFLSELIED